MKITHNILSKIFLLLILALGWGSSAWAERIAPTIVSAITASNENNRTTWCYIHFVNSNGGYVYCEADGNNLAFSGSKRENNDNLWALIGTQSSFVLRNRNGLYAKWDGTKYVGTSDVNAATPCTYTENTNSNNTSYWNLHRISASAGTNWNPQTQIKEYGGNADGGSRMEFAVVTADDWGAITNPNYHVIQYSPAPTASGWAGSTHWYRIKNDRSGKILAACDGYMDNDGYLKTRGSGTVAENSDLWCFVQEANGKLSIYNKTAGTNQVLGSMTNKGSNDVRTKLYGKNETVANISKLYSVGTNSNGYFVLIDGLANGYWDDNTSSGYLASWQNAQASASQGGRFIVSEVIPEGYKLSIIGDNDYTVTYDNIEYQNGNILPLSIDDLNLNNLTGFSINCTDKFVYGPVIDKGEKTVTYTIREMVPSVDDLTTGFYQLQLFDDNNQKVNNVNTRINGSTGNINTRSNTIYVMPYKDVPTGGDQNLAKYSGVPTYANEASTFFYIEKNGSDLQLQSVNGHYAVNDGNRKKPVATRNASSVTSGYAFPDGHLQLTGWVIQGTWNNNGCNGIEGPRMAYSGGTNYEKYNAAKVDLSQYSIYKVVIENATNASDIANDPNVTIISESDADANNRGLNKVYRNGYLFFKNGYVPTVEDFNLHGTTYDSNFRIDIGEEVNGIRTITFGVAGIPFRVIITGDKKDDEVITYHNHHRFKTEQTSMLADGAPTSVRDGETFLFKAATRATDLLDCDFSSHADSRTTGTSFIYGPVIDWENHTITCEIREAITGLPETGWYQLKWDVSTDNNVTAANRYTNAREDNFTNYTRDEKRFYITMPKGGVPGRNEHMTYSAHPTDETTPLTLVKLVRSGNNVMMMSIDGRYLNEDATASTSGSGYANPVTYVDGELDFRHWFPFNNLSYIMGKATNTHNYFYTTPAKFDEERFEFYEVKIHYEGFEDILVGGTSVTYNGPAQSCSKTTVYTGGYVVLPKGTTITKDQFTVNTTYKTFTIDTEKKQIKIEKLLPYVIHRPNGLLWKAKRFGNNKENKAFIGPHTPNYVEVKQTDGTKVKLQNTNEFEVVHYIKPGAADGTQIWYPTTASSGGAQKALGYCRMFNYNNEYDVTTIAANHNRGAIIAAAFVSGAGTRVYANGYANTNTQQVYGKYFTAKLPSDFSKTGEYVLAFESSRMTDAGAGHFGEGLMPDGNASYLRDLAEDGTPLDHFTDPNGQSGTDNLLEGTISLRQIYRIRSAYAIADQLADSTAKGKFMEEETIIFPTKNTEWNNYHNVLPLAYNCVDYWGYTSSAKTDVKNLDWQNNTRTDVKMVASVVGENTAGITINTGNNGFLNSTGVFTEKGTADCRLSARYVTFKYPNDGIITTTGNEEKTATIEVKLIVDGQEYNVKRFNLRFVPNTDPVPHSEIFGHDDHSRSDAMIESRYGKPYEEISFEGEANYVCKYPSEPLEDLGNSMSTDATGYRLYYQYPVDFGQMSYSNYTNGVANGDKWVEWGEYGVTRRSSLVSINYLRAQYKLIEAQKAQEDAAAHLEDPDLTELERAFYTDQKTTADANVAKATQMANDKYYKSFYIYADASEQPGSIANLKINETLCPGTQFYVTAWVSNGTEYDQSSSANPNSVIFRVQGRDAVSGEYETLVAYCPGQISKSARAKNRDRLRTVSVTMPDGSVNNAIVPWQQVAFSFTNTAPATKYTEFRIQIDNNSRGADGADIYLDNIRLYVKRPEVTVRDAAPVCGHELDLVRITTDFDAMMESINGNTSLGVGGDSNTTYYGVYAIIDKAKYEKLAAEEDHAKAFEDALLGSTKLSDCKTPDGILIPSLYAFHTIKFFGNYDAHALLTYNDLITSEQRAVAGRMELEGSRTLVFNCKIEDENLEGGKEYILIFSVQIAEQFASPEYLNDQEPSFYVDYFNLLDNCRIIYPFKVSSATMVRLDGAEGVDPYHIDYCPGSAPNIKLTSYSYNLETGKPEPEVGVAYDWYYGTLEQYKEEVVTAANCTVEHPSEEKVDHTLDQALMNLRYFYPNVDENSLSTVQPRAQEASHGVDYILTDCMIAQLNRLVDSGKLKLRKTNAMFELSKLEDEEEYHSAVAIKIYGRIQEDATGHHIYCAEPIEVKFYTKHETPGAAVGINGVDYAHNTPFNVRDKFGNLLSVPTRINSAQVSQLTSKNAKTYLRLPINVMEPSGYYKTDVDDGNGNMTPQNTNQVKFLIDPTNTDVVVVETNDPQWKVYEVSGSELYMPVVGKLKEIIARKSRSKFPWLASSTETDQLGIDFSDPTIQRKFEPREGYYYVLRASFLEEADEYDVAEDDPNFNPEYKTKFKFTKSKLFDTEGVMRCPGTILIPLKVVPQYMKWTGRESNDWNNDRNWIRADYSELVPSEPQNPNDTFAWYRTNIKGNAGGSLTVGDENGLPVSSNDGKLEKDMDIYIPMDTPTPASPYANTFAYAPMEDTHVIIPADCEQYPALVTHSISTTTGTKGLLQLADGGEVNTPYITYDMVARLSSETDAGGIAHKIYSAEPYYENHIKDITFQMGGTMYDAQRLTYDKAWLEYALATNRWHTIGSPLQETVSGEWYSPTASGDEAGRQLTPYFEEITYSPSLNNRFNPAYYQRSWDKATTNVYRMASDGMYMPTKNPINVAVSLDWSNVYNDVNVPYSAGGFSVKPVLADGADGEVLVRMPKADTSYLYYDHANTVSGHPTTITRGAGHYRLNSDLWKNSPSFELTVSNANSSENLYYLVSNPMMAPMNMEEFFNENTQFVPNTYWIMKDNLQSVSVKTDMGWISTDAAEGGVVAPLQAFFVKLKTAPAGSSIQVSYTPEMQEVVAPSARPALKARASRGAHSSAADSDVCDLPLLRITATNAQGALQSQALVCFSQEASAAYAPGEDAELLLDSNTAGEVASVFTMSDGQALHLNAIGTNVKMIPLGVVAPTDDTETTLTLTGLSALEEVMAEAPSLYDAANGSFIPLQEGSTLTIQGTSAGRYYLVSGMQLPAEDTISDSNRDYYNLQGIRVASPQHGTVTISRHQKQLMR